MVQQIIEDKPRFTENIQKAAEAERIISFCFERLASLTKNGRVRKAFGDYARAAQANKTVLENARNRLGITDVVPHEQCELCKVDPANFSLAGALKLGAEIEAAAIRTYEILSALCNDAAQKKVFTGLLKDKIKQKNFLKKEQRFVREETGPGVSFFDSYCIPHVSKLLK